MKQIHYEERLGQSKAREAEIWKVVAQIEDAKAGQGPPVIIDTQRFDCIDRRIRKAMGLS